MKYLRLLTAQLFAVVVLALILIGALSTAKADALDCRSTAVYDASTNGSTVLVTGNAVSSIRVCGFNLWAAGTATVKLVTGTGVACATNETAITPAYSLTTQTGVPDSSPFWRGLLAGPGLDLCIKTSAGVAVQMQLYYVRN